MTIMLPSLISFRHQLILGRDTLNQEELFPDDCHVKAKKKRIKEGWEEGRKERRKGGREYK